MKDSQWAIAVGVLAVIVFIIVFAGQYLGGGPGGPGKGASVSTDPSSERELTFATKSAPSDGGSPIEVEQKGRGEALFFFVNDNAQPVKVGLIRSSCRCTVAELYLLKGNGSQWFAGVASGLIGQSICGPLSVSLLYPAQVNALAGAAQWYELKKDQEAVSVPPGGGGWVRMGWDAEQPGPIRLDATLWMEDPQMGKRATLEVATFVHESFRVRSNVFFGTVREANLRDGVRNDLIVWSATRPAFRLKVNPGSLRIDPRSDPLEIGTPELLTPAERREAERSTTEPVPGGMLSAWRVPLTLRAMAADGKTPCDIGPFSRTLLVTSPDFPTIEKVVNVSGRVRGLVEFGNDNDMGELNLGVFSRKVGKTDSINLTSELTGLDTNRTAKFLTPVISDPEPVGTSRRQWKLKLTVKPGAAFGRFPRKEDALYEDSAVYLIGTAPGQPPRTVRIAVMGSATESVGGR